MHHFLISDRVSISIRLNGASEKKNLQQRSEQQTSECQEFHK